MIEPEIREMWPDYSPAEKTYMAAEAAKNRRNANDIGIAFLGPLAARAAAGLSRVGLRTINEHGVVEPQKLLKAIAAMKEGEFAAPADYAAMQFVRNAADQSFIQNSVRNVLGIARMSGITDEEALQVLAAQTRMHAKKNSPFRSLSQDGHNPPSPDQGPDR